VSRYGPEAAHSSLMLGGTARNIGLFFVDVGGFGQRVLVKSGTAFVRARVRDTATANQLPSVSNQHVESV
jgi:spartin